MDIVVFGLLVAALIVSGYLTIGSRRLAGDDTRLRRLLLVDAALFDALCCFALIFIVSEDTYRSDGRSRWEVYGGHAWVVAAIASGLFAAGLAAVATRRPGLRAVVGPAGIAAVAVSYVAFVANTSN